MQSKERERESGWVEGSKLRERLEANGDEICTKLAKVPIRRKRALLYGEIGIGKL